MFSIIVPVYNRPDEMQEFLQSLSDSHFSEAFEVVVVEDGSKIPCRSVVEKYSDKLDISYFDKPNSGPGDSRNFGMRKAKGDYFLIFDSDCIIPPQYLQTVSDALKTNYVDCFGGPDAALDSFSAVQKAINFAMTSVLTTGGVRGASEKLDRFQPRSFNMGISRKAFEASGGFGNIHPGEDPDLSIRLWKSGFSTRLLPDAFVYHKRRIDWGKFRLQVSKFGKARPILDSWYPEYAKLTYFFPTVFIIGFYVSAIALLFGFGWFAAFYVLYFVAVLIASTIKNKSAKIGLLSVLAVYIQFSGYGFGFLQSFVKVRLLGKKPEYAFPELFFRKP